MRTSPLTIALAIVVAGFQSSVLAQTGADRPAASTTAAQAAPAASSPANAIAGITPPAGYVIGPDDQLSVVFWRDKDMSGDVTVRPDGMITLPLLNDVPAAGLTPEELRVALTQAATKFVEEPNVSVAVRQINSRKVFITGQVAKPSPYPLMGPMTVLQLITLAGGVLEYADADKIQVLRTENGKPVSFRVNYDDLKQGKSLHQNIELQPGDQVVVP